MLTILDTDTLHTENTAPAEAEAFHITDEASANWYARKLATIESERARVRAQAAQIVAQLDREEKRLRESFETEARLGAGGTCQVESVA